MPANQGDLCAESIVAKQIINPFQTNLLQKQNGELSLPVQLLPNDLPRVNAWRTGTAYALPADRSFYALSSEDRA